MSIGLNLRKLRHRQNKSQQEIADLLEVDRRTYINWENEENDIKSDYLPKLAKIFNVEIKDLYEIPKTNIEINQAHNEGKDNSLLNGAILIITDKDSIDDFLNIIKNKLNK